MRKRKKIELALLIGLTLLVWVWVGRAYLNMRHVGVKAGGAAIECGVGCLCGYVEGPTVNCKGPSVCHTYNGGTANAWSDGTVYWDGPCTQGSDWGHYSMPIAYCPGPCSGGSTTTDTCGNYNQPSCSQGTCSGGKVCVGTGTTGCGCSNGFTCADVVSDPKNLAVARVSPTSATITWTAPNKYQYVTGQRVVMAKSNADALNCLAGQTLPGCVVNYYTTDKTVGSYDATGLLKEGTYYWVHVRFYTDVVKFKIDGVKYYCDGTSSAMHLSSCRFVPGTVSLPVGDQIVMANEVKDPSPWSFRTSFAITSGASYVKFPTILNQNPDQTYPYSIKVDGVTDGAATLQNTVLINKSGTWVGICRDNATVNVGNVVVPVAGPWWQAVGAGVYAGSSAGGVLVKSEVPSGSYLIIPGTMGDVGALMRASGSYDTGSGNLSTTNTNARTTYKGKKMDFGYFGAKLGLIVGMASDWSVSDEITLAQYPSANDFGYIKPISGTATISNPMSVLSGQKYVILVDGDLNISSNITVESGGYLMFIVKGNINIESGVTAMAGIYVSDGVLSTVSSGGGADNQIVISGSVVAWGGVELYRDLGTVGNVSPAEKFVYRPDLIETMPQKVKEFTMEWNEVTPGTYGN